MRCCGFFVVLRRGGRGGSLVDLGLGRVVEHDAARHLKRIGEDFGHIAANFRVVGVAYEGVLRQRVDEALRVARVVPVEQVQNHLDAYGGHEVDISGDARLEAANLAHIYVRIGLHASRSLGHRSHKVTVVGHTFRQAVEYLAGKGAFPAAYRDKGHTVRLGQHLCGVVVAFAVVSTADHDGVRVAEWFDFGQRHILDAHVRHMDLGGRIDLQDAFTQSRRFEFAHVKDAALVAADVVVAEYVHVYQEETPYPGACQLKGDKAAYRATAYDYGTLAQHDVRLQDAGVAREYVYFQAVSFKLARFSGGGIEEHFVFLAVAVDVIARRRSLRLLRIEMT